jgi:hypothetical protein
MEKGFDCARSRPYVSYRGYDRYSSSCRQHQGKGKSRVAGEMLLTQFAVDGTPRSGVQS